MEVFPFSLCGEGTLGTVGPHLPVKGMDFLPQAKQMRGLNSLTDKKTEEVERPRRYTHGVKTDGQGRQRLRRKDNSPCTFQT